jgi:hypothetical protein
VSHASGRELIIYNMNREYYKVRHISGIIQVLCNEF